LDLSIIQGPFSVAPCQTLVSRFATFASPCGTQTEGGGDAGAELRPAAVAREAHAGQRERELEEALKRERELEDALAAKVRELEALEARLVACSAAPPLEARLVACSAVPPLEARLVACSAVPPLEARLVACSAAPPLPLPLPRTPRTAMQKVRIVILGFGTW
jgi:hypothetical protein